MNILPKWRAAPNIVVVGQLFDTSRTTQRIKAMQSLGCHVIRIATTPDGHDYETSPSLATRIRHRFRRPADPANANANILAAVNANTDILWLDAADMISGRTLSQAKQRYPNLAVVWYSEDDMMNKRLRTKFIESAVPYIDLWVTTKSFNTTPDEVPSLGVKRMLFVNNSCDPDIHKPVNISNEEKARYGSPISFIGTFETPRANSVLHLARSGYEVRVWGNGWGQMKNSHDNLTIEGRPAYNSEFAKVVAASEINLCFLRHANRDKQTCRSVEIPSCGGFMAHERNSEIEALFRDNAEAVFFSNDGELTECCAEWLQKPEERELISEAARSRVATLNLYHHANITHIINGLTECGALRAL